MFYFGAIFLVGLAAVFAAWPLLVNRRQTKTEEVNHSQVVRQVYRDRVAELTVETEDAQLRTEIENELGAVLLNEVQADQPSDDLQGAMRYWIVVLLAFAVPLAGVATYFVVAEPELQNIVGAEKVLRLGVEDEVELALWAEKLSKRTASAPDDGESWYLLASSYLKLGRYSDAAEAFAITSKLVPEDMNVQVYWLQARYLAADRQLDSVSRGIAEAILEQQPDLSVVIEILAWDAFTRGDSAQAVTLLNRAVTGARNARDQAALAVAIEQVRSRINPLPPGVTVNVSAQENTPSQGTVFVVARPVGGGMPYAVVRRPVFLLPFTVTLDDLVSMSSERRLSDAERFEVIVRLSLSGNAMAEAGDWQWLSEPVDEYKSEPVNLDALLTPP